MKLESVGILIGIRPFKERDIIATVFTRDFGILKGMIRAGQITKTNRPMLGNFGLVSWNARLDSSLGIFHFESDKNLITHLMRAQNLLMFANSAFALLSALLPEREKYENLFNKTIELFLRLNNKSEKSYIDWELELLQQLGYGLNMNGCSNCGCTNDLNYLSPNTGRAVCNKCAAPYIDKLFRLPIDLQTIKKFIGKVCIAHGIKIPIEREILN